MKKYIIVRIEEPDFGCEGLPDGQVKMDNVYLQDEDGNELIIRMEDSKLYEGNINEGDEYWL